MFIKEIFKKVLNEEPQQVDDGLDNYVDELTATKSSKHEVKIVKDGDKTKGLFDLSILVICDEDYANLPVLESVKYYLKNKVPLFFMTDDEQVANDLASRAEFKACSQIVFYAQSTSLLSALEEVLPKIPTKYMLLLKGNSVLKKSVLFALQTILGTQNHTLHVKDESVLQDATWDPTLNFLAGSIFDVAYLNSKIKKISKDRRFWLGAKLLEQYSNLEIAFHRMSYCQYKFFNCDYLQLFSRIFNDLFYIIENDLDIPEKRDGLDRLIRFGKMFLRYNRLTVADKAMLASSFALFYIKYGEKLSSPERYKRYFNEILFLDEHREDDEFYSLVERFAAKLYPEKLYDLCLIEYTGENDLEKSKFFKSLAEQYRCFYLQISMPEDYQCLDNVICKLATQMSKVSLSSDLLVKHAVSQDARLLALPLHTMLEPAKADNFVDLAPQTILSSKASPLFSYPLPLLAKPVEDVGNLHSDPFFAVEDSAGTRKKISDWHHLRAESKIIFFAQAALRPTEICFDFGMNTEVLASRLKAIDTYLLVKIDPIYRSIFSSYTVDLSGLESALNGYVLVDDVHTFTQLLQACDIFMTNAYDLLPYAILAKKPLVLYRPQLETMRVPYPVKLELNELLSLCIEDREIDSFINKIQNLPSPDLGKYDEFIAKYFPLCDGRVEERVSEMISSLLA